MEENATRQYTDLQVVNKILAGETALFEILIRRNNPALYKTGRAYNYSCDALVKAVIEKMEQ